MSNLVQTPPKPFADAVVEVELEEALRSAVVRATSRGCPPRLAQAIHYAVFPGGARLRPLLVIAVATALGAPSVRDAVSVASAVELLHCGSLVHDDLPCFDDAELRRGRPSLARAFDVPTAVLVGDALIVHAFEELADVIAHVGGARGATLLRHFGSAVGARGGLVAGQAWELEAAAPLETYHRAKTGSLFALAARAAAILAGVAQDPWAELGDRLGLAYQASDDVADATGDAVALGKSTRRDAQLDRPSLVRTFGIDEARGRSRHAIDDALGAIPPCARAEELRLWLASAIERTGVVRASGMSSPP